MIEIYIGPNGFGKTKKLEKKRDELIENGGVEKTDILFLESEILLSDEVKDTKDETLAMEYILYELLENNDTIKNIKNELQTEINNVINKNAEHFNSMIKEVLETNKQESNQNFITVNQKGIKYKNLVSIENKDFWMKTGSGQRMQLLLHLVKNSSKKYIFLDEPEKYSHPSMLNKTAKIIKQLDEDGKQVFISTHSPKLLQMLDIELSKIYIFNDITYEPKNIKLDSIISDLSSNLSVPINNYDKKYAKYYQIKTCESMIKKIHYKEFLECLFAEKIYMCEGINDKLFLEKYLQDNNKFYEEYSIISTYGKFSMPLFLSIFKSLKIDVFCIFDKDDEEKNEHKKTNEFIREHSKGYYEFIPNLEEKLGYKNKKSDNLEFYNHISNTDFSKDENKIIFKSKLEDNK